MNSAAFFILIWSFSLQGASGEPKREMLVYREHFTMNECLDRADAVRKRTSPESLETIDGRKTLYSVVECAPVFDEQES